MLTVDDIKEIVESGGWSRLIGQRESDCFDCKKTGYDLRAPAQKQELVKDISSFANADGGFVLLGVETKKSASHPGDEVTGLRPFPSGLLDPAQYHNVLDDWVIPKLEGVSVEWVAEASGRTQGFGIIHIPAQPELRKPFVISKVVLESGRRRDMLVGYAQRNRDTSQPATATEVARWISDGRIYQTLIQTRLDEISAKLSGPASASAAAASQAPPGNEQIWERIRASLAPTGLINRPHYVLAASPDIGTEARTLFASGPGTITRVLENPPVLRHSGWSLETLDRARIIEGRFRQLTNGDDKVLRLYRDGTLVFAAAADAEFLGWADSDEEFRDNPRLNSLALIEVTYLFCLCYAEVLKDLAKAPHSVDLWSLLGGLRHTGTARPVFLNPHPVDAVQFRLNRDIGEAPLDSFFDHVNVRAEGFDAEAAAYEVIRELYVWFGIEPSLIPYVLSVNGVMKVDTEAIRQRG